MKLQRLFIPLLILALFWAAWRAWGWPGVAAAGGGVLMWLLLHFTRLMAVLKKAADRPIGHVDSAVMLNARLRKGVTLMHVVAMTRSLGAPQSPENVQPELYRWTDAGGSYVTCEFRLGRLTDWTLMRPQFQESQQGTQAP